MESADAALDPSPSPKSAAAANAAHLQRIINSPAVSRAPDGGGRLVRHHIDQYPVRIRQAVLTERAAALEQLLQRRALPAGADRRGRQAGVVVSDPPDVRPQGLDALHLEA